MSATIRDIVTDAQGIVGEVAGAGVQSFSEDRMFNDTVRAFNMMFKKYHWHQYRQWYTGTLDGILGIVTADLFAQILDFEDFIDVYYDKDAKPLPVWPIVANPFVLTAGTRPAFWTSLNVTDTNYSKRKLQFYPQTAIGTVRVLAMKYPIDPTAAQNWDWEDKMYLDRDMLAYATAFMTLSGDDLNAAAAGVAKGLMEDRFDSVTKALAKHPILVSGGSNIPTYYQEYPY